MIQALKVALAKFWLYAIGILISLVLLHWVYVILIRDILFTAGVVLLGILAYLTFKLNNYGKSYRSYREEDS